MKAQKLRGREGRNSAKIFLMFALFIFLIFLPLKADTVWLSGHHEILDGDAYTEIWMYNDATADMFGGDVYKLEMFDTSSFDMLGGVMDIIIMRNNSVSYIRGGNLGALGAIDNSVVNLYAYDVIHHLTGGHYDRGWVEGKYYLDGASFDFDLGAQNTYQHINIVPEPSTLAFLALGFLAIRRLK
ncbi:MAG: PEP-CTERM sorting domain-containing protein [Planctomycetota bacterium]|jgi:hypothetical protein